MNTIKKIVIILVLSFIQSKLSAQVQNSSSVQEVSLLNTTTVNVNRDINLKSFTKIGTSPVVQLLTLNAGESNINAQDSSQIDLTLPHIIDLNSMDKKPE